MSIAEDLLAANNAFKANLKPIIDLYEKQTGLRVESISIRREGYIDGSFRIMDIQVRTNADTL